jgi:hypothetical protein
VVLREQALHKVPDLGLVELQAQVLELHVLA